MKKKKIKYVYFDIGGVLVHWKPVFKSFAKDHKVKVRDVKKIYFENDTAAGRGEIYFSDFYEIFKELRFERKEDKNVFTTWLKAYIPMTETAEFLKEVSKTLPVGLLTNIHHGAVEKLFELNYIPKLSYQSIIESCKVGYVKPEREIYEIAQKQAGVDHSEILFLDDSMENIQAVRKMGWNGIQFLEHQPQKSIQQARKLLQI